MVNVVPEGNVEVTPIPTQEAQLQDYLNNDPSLKELLSRLAIQEVKVKPWRDGRTLVTLVTATGISAYSVLLYIEPTKRAYKDNPFEWAFLACSLVYNFSLMLYFSQPTLRSFINLDYKNITTTLRPRQFWPATLEWSLAAVSAFMMEALSGQGAYNSLVEQALFIGCFTLLNKPGARELMNNMIVPLTEKIRQKTVLRLPTALREHYILQLERDHFITGLLALVEAEKKYIRQHRALLPAGYKTLATELKNNALSRELKQIKLLLALFELPTDKPTQEVFGRGALSLFTTGIAFIVTTISQLGLYKNAMANTRSTGIVTALVNNAMALLMAKSLGAVVKETDNVSLPLARNPKIIAAVSAATFALGFLTAGTTAEENKIYYQAVLPDWLFTLIQVSTYTGSAFFNAYGVVAVIMGLYLAYHLHKPNVNIETDLPHQESVLLENLNALMEFVLKADAEELLKVLDQLHQAQQIDLNRIGPYLASGEWPSHMMVSERVKVLAQGGDITAKLNRNHSYRLSHQWLIFIRDDLFLMGGIIATRYLLPAIISTAIPALPKQATEYAGAAVIGGTYAAIGRLTQKSPDKTNETEELIPAAEEDDAVSITTTIGSSAAEVNSVAGGTMAWIFRGLCHLGQVALMTAVPAGVGIATEVVVRNSLTMFFAMRDEEAGNIAMATGAVAAAATVSQLKSNFPSYR